MSAPPTKGTPGAAVPEEPPEPSVATAQPTPTPELEHASAPVTSRFALNTLVVLAVAVLGQFLGWVATHEFFRQDIGSASGSAELNLMGLATLYMTISSVIYTLGDFRFVSAYSFFVARGGKVGPLTGAYLIFRFASIGVIALGFVLLSPVVAPLLGVTIQASAALELFLLVPIIETPSFVYSYLMAARGKAARGTWPLVLENAIRTPALVFVAFLYTFNPALAGTSLDLLGLKFTVHMVSSEWIVDIGWAYVVGATIPFFAIIVHSLVSEQGLYRHVTLTGAREELRSMLVFATPLIGAMFLTYAVSSLPPFALAAAFPSMTGLIQAFSSANAFLLLLMFLPNAITIPLFPDMAGLFVRGEHAEMRRRTRKSMRWTVMILAPAILSVMVFRHVLLDDLYTAAVTHGITDAQWALVLLAASTIPQSLFRIMGSVLDAVGQQKRELYLSAVQLAVLGVAIYVVVAPWSHLQGPGDGHVVSGVAAAVFLSTSAGFVCNAWFLHKYVRVHPSPRPYVTIIAAATAAFLLFSNTFVGLVGGLVGQPNLAIPVQIVWVLVVTVVVGVLIYVGVLAAVGELTKQDVRELGGSLGLPRWLVRNVAKICWREGWPDPDDEGPALPI